MSAISFPSGKNKKKTETSDWRSLYLNALFEKDKSCLPSRILSAERALVRRERELFATGSGTDEKTTVNNALHALRALRQCLGLH
jgi:hypothetical protein